MADDASGRGAALRGSTPAMVRPAAKGKVSGDLCIPCHDQAHQPCCVVALRLGCSHSDRNYTLVVPSQPTRGKDYVLQVLGTSEKPDLVAVGVNGGPCVLGKPHIAGKSAKLPKAYEETSYPSAWASGHELNVKAATPFRFAAGGAEDAVVGSWRSLFRLIVSPDSFMERYSVGVTACAGVQDLSAIVEVFPVIKGKGSMSFGIEDESVARGPRSDGATAMPDFKFEAGGELTIGDATRKLGVDAFSEGGPLSEALCKRVRTLLLPLCRFIYATDQKGSSLLKFKPPAVECGFEVGREEKTGDWRVETALSLSINFKPLLKCAFKYDLLPPLIYISATASTAVAGGCGAILAKMLAEMAEHRSRDGALDFGLDFTATGEIDGALTWKVPEAVSGLVDASIAFEVKGTFKLEYRKWLVKAGASVSAGAQTKVGAKFEPKYAHGFAASGQLYFGGLKIYYAYKTDFGFGDSSREPEHKPKSGGDLTAGEDVEGRSWMLIDEASWPEKPSLTPLSRDFF